MTSLPVCTDSADLAFIIDTSESSEDRHWRTAVNFTQQALALLPVGRYNVRVAAIAFSNKAYIQFGFNDSFSKIDLEQALDNITYHDQRSNVSGAIRLARQELFQSTYGSRDDIRNIAVVVSDGGSDLDTHLLVQEAYQAHTGGIQIYAVGVGKRVNKQELSIIASDPDEAHVIASGSAQAFIEKALTLKWGGCTTPLPGR